MDRTLIVGIAGGTGSGKTTFTHAVADRLGDDVTIISHDNYYRAHHDMPLEERAHLNYDHPDAYETDLMVRHLGELKQGRAVQIPVYDFSIHDRVDQTITVNPSPVILVEGIMVFYEKALRELMDVRVFVDADADVRILRRALRDMSERGRSLQSVIDQYTATVKPMHERYVERTKRHAHIIVPQGRKNDMATELLVCAIREMLRS